MKTFIQQAHIKHRISRVLDWGKLISITGGAQLVVQGIGFMSGILVIRVLPTHEYAWYTLANAMLGTMTILADGGIASGVLAQGGKVWQEKSKLGQVLATGLDLRRKFAVGSLLVATPIMFFLLRHHDASWLMTILIIASLIPAFFSALSSTLLDIPLKLKQDIIPLQKNQVGANLGRLLLLLLTLFIFPWAFIAILASGLPQIWANLRLRKLSSAYADWNESPAQDIRNKILSFVKRILPGSIYYCLSGQISIWLISIFGSTSTVAQLGALGRLAILLNLISTLFGTLISPRFARMPTNKKMLLHKFMLIQSGFILLNSFILLIVWMFPHEILWILGKEYAMLSNELVLIITGSCINLLAGLSFSLFTSRGFAINPMISIPVSILAIILGAVLLNISSLQGILLFNICIATVQFIMNSLYGLIKIININNYAPATV
jgi:O-antigen/teichoic acid export membrane protein